MRIAKFHTVVHGEEVPEVGSTFNKTDCLIIAQKSEGSTDVEFLYADGNGKVVKPQSATIVGGSGESVDLSKKVDKVDGKQLSTEDFTTFLKEKLEGINLELKVDKVEGKGLSTEDFTTELKAKLEGLSSEDYSVKITAIENLLQSDDTNLDDLQEIVSYIKLNKETLNALSIESIAGLTEKLTTKADDRKVDEIKSELLETIQQLQTTLDTKQEKVEGKGLSTNDFTNEYKSKLDNIGQGGGSSSGGNIKRAKYVPEKPESEDDVYILDNFLTVIRVDGKWKSNLELPKFEFTDDEKYRKFFVIDYDFSKFSKDDRYNKTINLAPTTVESDADEDYLDVTGLGDIFIDYEGDLNFEGNGEKLYFQLCIDKNGRIEYECINHPEYKPDNMRKLTKIIILDTVSGYVSEPLMPEITGGVTEVENITKEEMEEGVVYQLPNSVLLSKSGGIPCRSIPYACGALDDIGNRLILRESLPSLEFDWSFKAGNYISTLPEFLNHEIEWSLDRNSLEGTLTEGYKRLKFNKNVTDKHFVMVSEDKNREKVHLLFDLEGNGEFGRVKFSNSEDAYVYTDEPIVDGYVDNTELSSDERKLQVALVDKLTFFRTSMQLIETKKEGE